jgi:hypothetical protein
MACNHNGGVIRALMRGKGYRGLVVASVDVNLKLLHGSKLGWRATAEFWGTFMACGSRSFMQLAKDRDQWRALVETVMNHLSLWK